MNPHPLRITQAVILTLHLYEPYFPLPLPVPLPLPLPDIHARVRILAFRTHIPQEEIGDAAAPSAILLGQNPHDAPQAIAAKARHDVQEILDGIVPAQAHDARLAVGLARPHVADEVGGAAVLDVGDAVV
ncbi:hypothetical protein EYC84_002702 [Monilinia fructicola]|uniref:Uncharacterized protein n=1 Tax=Monilinia fructicola TaxID=38448 RepID=A0A5M9JRH1_MONFR|nr:hypothetical protein EYC84_002702 [Monilinia fructicola]